MIQPYCQAEYGGISQESRTASDRLDRPFPAPLSPALMAALQVPRRQAAAAAARGASKAAARHQASEQPRGTVAASMAAAAASQEPPNRSGLRGAGSGASVA